jgi:hypothetical protein
MRILACFIVLLSITAARAQITTNAPAPATNPAPVIRTGPQLFVPGPTPAFVLREPKPNEIIKGRVTYSGVAVEAFKTRHPLQLINPLAPDTYGSPEDNVARSGPKGRILGLKLFAVSFK